MSKLPFFDYFRENILITQKKGVKCTFVLLFMNPALLYRSRQGDARPPLASRSEYGDASTPTSSKGVSLNELQEGDVLLLRGRRFDSTVIATMSDGVSHCGQMIKFDHKLWFAECVSIRGSQILLLPQISRGRSETRDDAAGDESKSKLVKGCVSASALTEILPFYSRSEVLRPTPSLSEEELSIMRKEFVRIQGCAYETSRVRLVGAVVPLTFISPPETKFYCSSLTPHLFRQIERLNEGNTAKEKRRFKSGLYLPCSIRKAVRNRSLGHLQGTDALKK